MTETTVIEKVLCAGTTKKGLPCKNRPQIGGTLCGPHGKQIALDLAAELFKSTAIGKSHNRHAKTASSIVQLKEDVDELAQKVFDNAEANPPSDKQPDIVFISGDRDNDHPERTHQALSEFFTDYWPKPYVILGDAKGTDGIVEDWLTTSNLKFQIVKANWETKGGVFRKGAGMERNEECVLRCATLVAFSHEGYGDYDNGKPVDKGTTQAIEKAREAQKKVVIFNLSEWDKVEFDSRLEDSMASVTDETAAEVFQLLKAEEFAFRPSLISLNTSSWIYIGRGKQGTAMTFPGILALPRKMSHADFKRKLWKRMTSREPHLLRELARISETTSIVCNCFVSKDEHVCHGHIIIAASNFMHGNDGTPYRMTTQEIKDYDAANNPALLSTLPQSERTRIVARYSAMTRKTWEVPSFRTMNGGKKLSKATPLVKNSRVVYINGDLELPAVVTHIEYGTEWIDDQYTGRRRKEILNCTLFNEPINAHFTYSDSNAEMIRRGHRIHETGLTSEEGILPTIAPFIKKAKNTKSVMPVDLTTGCRIKSGMPIRIIDRATGKVMDVGIAKSINSAYWYKVVPQMPAIKDAWIVEYHSMLTNKSATWKGDEGTRIETAY